MYNRNMDPFYCSRLKIVSNKGNVFHGIRCESLLWQIALLFLICSFGCAFMLATSKSDTITALFTFVFVSVFGFIICLITQRSLDDPSLKVLGYFWLFKLGITLFLLYVSWIPLLDSGSLYDPIRYYHQAQELIENDWANDLISLNYVGILYYYAAIFQLIGHNPVIPAMVNVLLTLIASLYLIKVGYEIKGHKAPGDWKIAYILLLPEVVWYDVITSRETLVAALLIFALLTTGRYLAKLAPISLFNASIVVSSSALGIAAVRTSMLVPFFASILLMLVFVKRRNESLTKQRVILSLVSAFVLVVGLVVNKFIGGKAPDIGEILKSAISAKDNIGLLSPDVNWSNNSIGLLLMPEGVLQSLLYLPPRMILYLISPIPNVSGPLYGLLSGSTEEWQVLFTILSSVLNILAFPFAVASLLHSLSTRKENAAALIFHSAYWMTFIAIAGGNLIIHERYRVMATPLLWGCVWLGLRTCPRDLVIRASITWFILITMCSLFYLIYKIFL